VYEQTIKKNISDVNWLTLHKVSFPSSKDFTVVILKNSAETYFWRIKGMKDSEHKTDGIVKLFAK
jgi:hypothetical protein